MFQDLLRKVAISSCLSDLGRGILTGSGGHRTSRTTGAPGGRVTYGPAAANRLDHEGPGSSPPRPGPSCCSFPPPARCDVSRVPCPVPPARPGPNVASREGSCRNPPDRPPRPPRSAAATPDSARRAAYRPTHEPPVSTTVGARDPRLRVSVGPVSRPGSTRCRPGCVLICTNGHGRQWVGKRRWAAPVRRDPPVASGVEDAVQVERNANEAQPDLSNLDQADLALDR